MNENDLSLSCHYQPQSLNFEGRDAQNVRDPGSRNLLDLVISVNNHTQDCLWTTSTTIHILRKHKEGEKEEE